jgi:hypothetical protein
MPFGLRPFLLQPALNSALSNSHWPSAGMYNPSKGYYLSCFFRSEATRTRYHVHLHRWSRFPLKHAIFRRPYGPERIGLEHNPIEGLSTTGGTPRGQPWGQPFTYDIFETEGGSDIMNRNIGSERQLEITSTNRIPNDDSTAVSELSRFTCGRRGKAGLRTVENIALQQSPAFSFRATRFFSSL